MNDNNAQSACEKTFRALAGGNFVDWSELPPQCGPTQLAAIFSGGETVTNGLLSGRPTKFRIYRVSEQSEVLQAWFDDMDHVILITITAPTINGDVKALLDHFGAPEKRLEQGTGYHADAHQWIYAGRGITLYLREYLNEIARIAVYPPTSVEHYLQHLGAKDGKRYWPRERKG